MLEERERKDNDSTEGMREGNSEIEELQRKM